MESNLYQMFPEAFIFHPQEPSSEGVYDISSLNPRPINGWGLDYTRSRSYTNAHFWGRRSGKTAFQKLLDEWYEYSINTTYFDEPLMMTISEELVDDAKAELEAIGWPVPLRHRVERGIY